MLRAPAAGPRPRPGSPRCQRGVGLVELMVGVAVGLFVVAAAVGLAVAHLDNNRRLQLEAQLQQDLRAALDIIGRELRRAGITSEAPLFVASATADGQRNPFDAMRLATGTGGGLLVEYSFDRNPGAGGAPTLFGFHHASVGSGAGAVGVIRTRIAGAWQELTDPQVVDVTVFNVTARPGPALPVVCPRECAGGGTACWPTVTVREYTVEVEARAVHDPQIVRSLATTVRVRNDLVRFNDPAALNRLCPT